MRPMTCLPLLVKTWSPALVLSGLLAVIASAQESDPSWAHWPQWRGPLANGVAPLSNPPIRWSETNQVKCVYCISEKP